ncbi:MAG: DUF4249 domain-containing protein [Flavobacteriaceae bacterium]|nr:DUF4249 domain-containing protein [Flavobacteriaceae bacterium]
MKKKFRYIIFFFILGIITSNCTEPIDIDGQLSFVDALVIQATITNEFKYQKILLTRTFRFEDDGKPKSESNAKVNIIDSKNNVYSFIENEPGEYISTIKFEATANTDYQLQIETQDGKKYGTTNKQLTNTTQIDNLYASREVNSVGTEVMSIYVESYDANRNSNYYRYEYEETYKIVPPNFVNQDFIVLTDDNGVLPLPGLVPRSNDERVCYDTVLSNAIIQTSTTYLAEDKVSEFSVRNIPIDDAIISHRYSILVKQYIQSLEAYTYYNIINQLSGSSSLFAQIQPGFINSNIYSLENKNEKVLGFFELTSVSEKRLFFNYRDFFPGEALPPYFIECAEIAPALVEGAEPRLPLVEAIQKKQVVYWEENINATVNEGPFLVVPTACGHCTALGSSEIPEFWVD